MIRIESLDWLDAEKKLINDLVTAAFAKYPKLNAGN
jgi:hypothetical protein